MAGWLSIAVRSFGVAALAGAAQLGAAQALSLLVWSSGPTPETWRRQLMWAVFIFAAAVLAGVAGGRRSVRAVRMAIANRRADAAAARNSGLVLHQGGMRAAGHRAIASARYRTVDTARGIAAGASRVGATVFASLGAYASFLLIWLAARHAYAAADIRVLALSALLGTAIGAVLAQLALLAAPIAANFAVWVAGVWIFGLASLTVAIATDVPTITPRLAVLDAPYLIGPDEWWLGPYLMVIVAAIFGASVAGAARWVGAHRLATAVSGAAGPAIIAAGYLLVGPQAELRSAYICALVAATVGPLTSTATAALPRKDGHTAGAPQAITRARRPAAARAIAAQPVVPAPAPAAAGAAPAASAYATTASAAPPPYPPPNPASQYPAAAQYSANPYPTNQYPTMPARAPATAQPPAPPAPSPAPPAPAPAAPAPTPPGPPPPAAPPPSPSKRSRAASPSPKATREAAPKATRKAAPKAAPKAASTAAAAPNADAAAGGGKASGRKAGAGKAGAGKAGAKTRHEGRADRTVRVPESTRPDPVQEASSRDLPRTARPAQVVAVQSSRASSEAMDLPKGRRARRRAVKLAEELAEQEQRLARQRERDAQSMGKREQEHVDWVQRLVSMPADPTLDSRRK